MENVRAVDVCVIGSGPAGLMAAEVSAAAGLSTLVAEAKPSPGRKFLMAGKSGLNLTMDAPMEAILGAYGAGWDWLAPMLEAFGPEQVQTWAQGLEQAVFIGSTGRVFPRAMKASPLLRAWLGRLGTAGVTVQTRWRWLGWDGERSVFQTPEGRALVQARATILALGGGSWARLGSDGAWTRILAKEGVTLNPFRPANMGFFVDWSPHMAPHFGAPVKNVSLSAAGQRVRGEFVITKRGVEGGAIYSLSAPLRDAMGAEGAQLTLDLTPDLSLDVVRARLARPRGKASLANHLRKVLGLDAAQRALFHEAGPVGPDTDLAARVKALPLRLSAPFPIDEAISTAGGVARAALDDTLMLKARAGVFCAGEMLDWEAPTGGYLITACLASGRWAGLGAVDRLKQA